MNEIRAVSLPQFVGCGILPSPYQQEAKLAIQGWKPSLTPDPRKAQGLELWRSGLERLLTSGPESRQRPQPRLESVITADSYHASLLRAEIVSDTARKIIRTASDNENAIFISKHPLNNLDTKIIQ